MVTRILAMSFALVVLLASAVTIAGNASLVLDGRAAAWVVGVPLLIAIGMRSPRDVLDAFADALSPSVEDLPPQRRERSADIVAAMGGQALAIGVLVVFLGALHQVTMLATESGSVAPATIVGRFGGLLLAPVYGLPSRPSSIGHLRPGCAEA